MTAYNNAGLNGPIFLGEGIVYKPDPELREEDALKLQAEIGTVERNRKSLQKFGGIVLGSALTIATGRKTPAISTIRTETQPTLEEEEVYFDKPGPTFIHIWKEGVIRAHNPTLWDSINYMRGALDDDRGYSLEDKSPYRRGTTTILTSVLLAKNKYETNESKKDSPNYLPSNKHSELFTADEENVQEAFNWIRGTYFIVTNVLGSTCEKYGIKFEPLKGIDDLPETTKVDILTKMEEDNASHIRKIIVGMAFGLIKIEDFEKNERDILIDTLYDLFEKAKSVKFRASDEPIKTIDPVTKAVVVDNYNREKTNELVGRYSGHNGFRDSFASDKEAAGNLNYMARAGLDRTAWDIKPILERWKNKPPTKNE